MSPGRRPSRNGNLAPNASNAPTPMRITPTKSSSFPSSRDGSMRLSAGTYFLPKRCPHIGAIYRILTLDELQSREKITDLESCGFRRVGAVRAVELDARAKLLADCARRRLRWIGGTHCFAPFQNRAFRLEDHHNSFAGAHKLGQLSKKRALAVDGVKSLRLAFRQPHRLDCHDLKFRGVDAAQDFRREATFHGIGLDDCESAVDRSEEHTS